MRASAVRFNPDEKRLKKVKEPEYKVFFGDPTAEEEDMAIQRWVTVTDPDKTTKKVAMRAPTRSASTLALQSCAVNRLNCPLPRAPPNPRPKAPGL